MLLITLTQYCYKDTVYTLKKMLGCFNPTLGQMWTNPDVGLFFLFKF